MAVKVFDMEYNSQKGDLVISEYGRNIQNLLHYALSIEDKEKRSKVAVEIVNLMNIMTPQNRSIPNYKEKLWNHLFRMSNYTLEVDVPEGITIHPINEVNRNHDLQYPSSEYDYRHYGHYIQEMIRKALTIEDEEKRNWYSEIIASYMKLAYRTWNREHFVSDTVIKNNLEEMSGNVLTFADDYTIENLISFKAQKKNFKPTNNNSKNNNNNRNSNSNNKNRNPNQFSKNRR
jgi:Domain of unknown function (DUF4290)